MAISLCLEVFADLRTRAGTANVLARISKSITFRCQDDCVGIRTRPLDSLQDQMPKWDDAARIPASPSSVGAMITVWDFSR